MNKMKLTLKEHQIIGHALKLINYKVSTADYTFENKKEMRELHIYKVNALNIKLKNHMEEIMIKDFPNESATDIYYGHPERGE